MPPTLAARSDLSTLKRTFTRLFPSGGSLSACAAGSYDDEQRNVASRLAANGLGDVEIRLGWEANGDWFPWVGRSADQWKQCFTRVANAMNPHFPDTAAFR